MIFSESVEVRRSVTYIRLYKGVFLPIELVGEKGKKMSNCFIQNEESSAIIWCHKTKIETLPTSKQWKN